jgi:hypothetical protein
MNNLIIYGLIIAGLIGFGAYKTNEYWRNWLSSEKARIENIQKEYYEKGVFEGRRLESEEKADQQTHKGLTNEAKKDPTANRVVLPPASVQRLNKQR